MGLTAAVVARADGPWLLGLAAIMAADAAVVTARAARLPAWAAWPAAVGCAGVGAIGINGADLALYAGLLALLLFVVDRFAARAVSLSLFCLPQGGAAVRPAKAATLIDPVAREFAHARREDLPLTVASIAVPRTRGAAPRLARVVRELVASLRRTDVIVRVAKERLVVVLPRADAEVASALLERSFSPGDAGVLVGTATFPHDGPTFAGVRAVALGRERPWPAEARSGGDRGQRFTGDEPDLRLPDPAEPDQRPATLLETRAAGPRLRRLADLVVLALSAPVTVPVIALLGLIVKLDSPGPAFISIERVGRDGRPFRVWKLRSMTNDADRMKEELRHLNILPWPDFKLVHDPRITRAGRWLRKYSLDELPQLYNVLRGEMTLVGPRPCSVALAHYEPWQGERLEVTPGLAGRWQADGRGTADFAARCRLDIRQAEAGSLRASLVLILATLRSVLRAKGAL
jgi:lipopolysaccharide/colanic/teichoic acid biosynthesis glycosyltransferase